MDTRKKHKGDISVNIVFDLEDESLIDYMETGDEPLPPIVKPKIKPNNAEKKRRSS